MTDAEGPREWGDRDASLATGRRRLLGAIGALTLGSTAGCTAIGGRGDTSTTTACDVPEDLSPPVPEPYRGAESNGGLDRKPSKLLPKRKGQYQTEPNGDQQCSKCSYYIPDKNGDCLGACVRLQGEIYPGGWCQYYRTQVGGGW